jgi:hypothetical protein
MNDMNYDFRLLFLYAYIVGAFYFDNIMKDFLKENSNYKTVAILSIISVTTLVMMFAGAASFDSYHHSVYGAAKNATQTTSSSSSSTSKTKGGSNNTSTTTKTKGTSVDARLQLDVHMRANCNLIFPCPRQTNMAIRVADGGDSLVDHLFGPNCGSTAGCSKRYDIPYSTTLHSSGDKYRIQATGGSTLLFTYQEAQILPQSNANCKGTNSCTGTLLPGSNILEVNFYWARDVVL